MKNIELTAFAAFLLLGSIHCSSHRCSREPALCEKPVDAKFDKSVILSKFDEISNLSVTVNDVGLREEWSGILWQDPSVTMPTSCDAVAGMPKACVKLNVTCAGGVCSSAITKTDLTAFAEGDARIAITQLPRPVGMSATLKVVPVDPNFSFRIWGRETVAVPMNYIDKTQNLRSIGIIKKLVYIARTYTKTGNFYCGAIHRHPVGGGASSDLPMSPPCDSNPDIFETPTVTGNGIWSTQKQNMKSPILYNLQQYSDEWIQIGPGNTSIALETTRMTELINLTASPDNSALFVRGSDNMIYWSTAPPKDGSTMNLLPIGTSPLDDPSIVPISPDLLLVIGDGSARRYRRTADMMSWTISTDPQLTSKKYAVGATADLNADGIADLVVADVAEVRIYAGDAMGGFALKNQADLPSSGFQPVSIAVGDLDGMPGPDIALIDKTSLYVALHN